MRFISVIATAFTLFAVTVVVADELNINSSGALKSAATQPYIVKKGDTLWDIADHFFKNPRQWLKIWEKNLYITNPDLIYPGNKIYLSGSTPGSLKVVQLEPHIVVKPVERLEGIIDASVVMTALMRQDFIHPGEMEGTGYIVDSRDDRINFGQHDQVYLKLNQPAAPGALLDVFRTTETVTDPASGQSAGVLVEHLGQIQVVSEAGGIYRGVVKRAFEEMSRGDRVKPARDPNMKLIPHTANKGLRGSVVFMRHDGAGATQQQVLGISLGSQDGIKPGMVMSVYKKGRTVDDSVGGGEIQLPSEKAGELIVLASQEQASLALVTGFSAPIHIGDLVQGNIQ